MQPSLNWGCLASWTGGILGDSMTECGTHPLRNSRRWVGCTNQGASVHLTVFGCCGGVRLAALQGPTYSSVKHCSGYG